MTAVRRLTTILTLLMAAGLSAQTTTTPTTPPAAQTPVQRTTAPVTAETDQDVSSPRALRLSLDEAIRTAIRQNLGIELQRYDYRMAGESLIGQYGLYDWYATSRLALAASNSAASNQFSAGSGRSITANFGVQQTVPTGGTYSFSFNNSRGSSTAQGTLFSPSYNSNLGMALTQPLLRDFGVDITNRNIYIARNTLGINKELFRTVLMDTSSGVEQAYLDLVYTREFVDVVKESLFLARDQARITQIRIDVGASAPLDILQPRVQIATSDELLIAAVAAVRDAEDRLRQLMNLAPSEWDRPIIPTDTVGYTPMTINVESAVSQAYNLRPEVREAILTTETQRILYRFARNQVLPRVDLTAGYNSAGVAGSATALGATRGLRSTSFPDALSQITAGDFTGWSVGFNLAVPLLNIGARAEARRAKLDLDRSTTAQDNTKQGIAVQVRAAARAIDTASRQITASRTAREAAEQNLDAERKRYENGMTTNFQVLQVQQQLTDARAREIQALVGYNKDVAAYHRAVGDLLEIRNIAVEEPAVQEPVIFPIDLARYSWLNYGSRLSPEEEKK